MTFPVNVSLVRLSGSVYSDTSVTKSTATSLWEIKLPSLMPDVGEQFIANLPVDDDVRTVRIEGGGSQACVTPDVERSVEFNKEDSSSGRTAA